MQNINICFGHPSRYATSLHFKRSGAWLNNNPTLCRRLEDIYGCVCREAVYEYEKETTALIHKLEVLVREKHITITMIADMFYKGMKTTAYYFLRNTIYKDRDPYCFFREKTMKKIEMLIDVGGRIRKDRQ